MHSSSLMLFIALLGTAGSVSAQNVTLQPAANPALLPSAEPNDHRHAAGQVIDGALRVELEAVEALWRPRGPEGPEILTPAFAEARRPPSVPGPLIRAAVGTPVHISIHNTLDRPIAVRGLFDRATAGIERPDGVPEPYADFFYSEPLLIPPGATREARFTPTAEVTSFYYGRIVYPQGTGDPYAMAFTSASMGEATLTRTRSTPRPRGPGW